MRGVNHKLRLNVDILRGPFGDIIQHFSWTWEIVPNLHFVGNKTKGRISARR